MKCVLILPKTAQHGDRAVKVQTFTAKLRAVT